MPAPSPRSAPVERSLRSVPAQRSGGGGGMSRLNGLLPAALARPFVIVGGVLFLLGAMLPWATFLLNDGAYPEKATLQYFDAPIELTGYRWHVLLFGVIVLIAAVAPLP